MMEPDDGVRLVLMELIEQDRLNFKNFFKRILEVEPDTEWTPKKAMRAYQDYCGWDGRTAPTKSIETGKRIW